MYDFDETARRLTAASQQPLNDRIALLKRLCPKLAPQIEQDCGPCGPLIFWGQCRNEDEFAGQMIVDPTILEIVFHLAKQRFVPEHPHAGLQHTYGYLLSIIETPYGRKRDRWTTASLESSFDLPLDVLSPTPADGTLLANATWLAGSIAFRGHNRLKWMQRCLMKRVAPAIQALQLDHLPGVRYTETIELPMHRRPESRVVLVTDLVQMPCADEVTNKESWLLVYSIDDSRNQHPQLVTLFAVTDDFVQAIHARAVTRRRDDIRLRYNAYSSGFPELCLGTVKLIRR